MIKFLADLFLPPLQTGAKALIVNEKGEYLLIFDKYGRHEFVWTLPGGHSERGETLEQTLAREVAEEIGMEVRILKPLGEWSAVMPAGTTTTYHVYLCSPLGRVTIKNNRDDEDIRDHRWVAKEEAISLASMNGLKEFLTRVI